MVFSKKIQTLMKFAASCSLFLSLVGCAALRPNPPEISLFGLELENLTLSHAILSANLNLYNPNDFAVTIKKVRYELALQGLEVAHGQSAESIRIGANSTEQLAVRLSSSYLNLLRIGQKSQGKENIPFIIKGAVTIGGFGVLSRDIPFRSEGIIPLQAWSTFAP